MLCVCVGGGGEGLWEGFFREGLELEGKGFWGTCSVLDVLHVHCLRVPYI